MIFTIVPYVNTVVVNYNSINVDCTSLDANIRFVEWTGNTGEIVYTSISNQVTFTDPSPYQNLINLWMNGASSANVINLAQAQSIKSDMIVDLANFKRQEPITFSVTAGNLSWDASDPSVARMGLQLSTVFSNVNSFFLSVNTAFANIVNQIQSAYNNAIIPNPFTAVNVSISGLSAFANVTWYTYNNNSPVALLATEFLGLMNAIEIRTANVSIATINNQSHLAAQTSIAQVMTFDVTANWPF